MRFLMVLAVLAGCSPVVTSSTARNVTIGRVRSYQLDEAAQLAQAECDEHDRDAEQLGGIDEGGRVTYKCVARATPKAEASPTLMAAAQPVAARQETYGQTPLFCAITAPDVGLCFYDEARCAAEKQKLGIASCELKNAGSCFEATKTLDHTIEIICAVSIKDCEMRRTTTAADPDYTVTAACGIYRQRS